MPYQKLEDLPDRVRDKLPRHAQEIFRAAFNSAEEQYPDEATHYKVAWAAVERDYEKDDGGGWRRKPD